ncbi:hypothetical protein [Nonomuraea wenchangensis]|uniref:Uncharacterized protein n=1 Tax=Nonomuraea wenchangensis TaxID=568860 RepID=A0A1I0EW32_9ACTN|nr:hypothetical protein [Nonomuraea wenchangensis]SET49858.1 hypothetical protein SAMN05421811_103232 [Nonomuraea wenchangensis]
MTNKPLLELHRSLDRRLRPEDVADLISLALDGSLSTPERLTLDRAAAHSYRRLGWVSSMTEEFAKPQDGAYQLAAVARLFDRQEWAERDPGDPVSLAEVAQLAGQEIGWSPDRADFKHDRLDRAARREAGIDVPKRQYNRRFRALGRLAAKAGRLGDGQEMRRLLLVGRSGFAATITEERFVADPDAACFVAYFTARRNLRRQFSLNGRGNPFDDVAQMLLARCEANPDTDWAMIAVVYAKPSVLARLADAERGEMLGAWYAVMRQCADRLERVWQTRPLNRMSMVVRRGDDSSTWNTVAQAYNAARAGWLACLQSMGALPLLDAACPGKVMRLMAADLAWWHRSTGGDVDPNTKVWASLPLPWEVLSGLVTCTRADVEQACAEAGLDPAETGWTASPAKHRVAAFKPTPELVHGVTVADPVWASLLRRAGVFSGKQVKPDLVEHAAHGLAAGVVVSDLPSRPLSGGGHTP